MRRRAPRRGKITAPLLLHVASEDQFFPAPAQDKLQAGLAGHPQVTIQVYQGNDHAFARIGGEHYDASAAQLANTRTLDHFKETLGS